MPKVQVELENGETVLVRAIPENTVLTEGVIDTEDDWNEDAQIAPVNIEGDPVREMMAVHQAVASATTALDNAATTAAKSEPVASALFREFVIGHIRKTTRATRSEAVEAVAHVEAATGRPILDWLTSGGLLQLLQLLIALFGPKL